MVSIIVPVYNCISSLERCVRSIEAQTCLDWELILVDDGSKDGSGTLCDELASCNPKIQVIHKKNGGVSSARNAGLDAAKGKHIMFCDSDDYPEPQWCELLLQAGARRPEAFAICNYFRHVNSEQYVNYEQACQALSTILPQYDFFQLYELELLGTPWNKLFRRDILEANRIRFSPTLSLGEDLLFNLEYLQYLPEGFTFVPQPLYHYILGNTQSLSAKYYPNLADIYEQIFSVLRQSLQRYDGAEASYAESFWKSCFFAFDRVFRNTWSDCNQMTAAEKYRFNRRIFHQPLFQQCRRGIPEHMIHPIQALALKTNSFTIYWLAVQFTEKVSRLKGGKYLP